MIRRVLLLLSGNMLSAILLFARNLLVARLISVEDYGIAATFAISMAIVEMLAQMGTQQLIVQDDNGNDPELQAGLQGFQLFRACISGAVLFALAPLIARFLHIEEITWAYQLLALIPVINGLIHFDIYRLNRQMRFLPAVLTNSVPALLSVLLIWPFYSAFGDYRVMLYAIMVQYIGMVAFSHVVAERRYQLRFDLAIFKRVVQFGWPLMINGILLFAVFNGDRLIVGREYGLEVLAIFSMGVTLTLTPTLVVARSTQSFFLPQLSAAKEDPDTFQNLAMATMQSSLVNGLVLVTGIVALGAPVVSWLLGEKYAALIPLLSWFAIVQALRVFRTGGAVVALSQGKTGNAMAANCARVLAMIPLWMAAIKGVDLQVILWIAAAGEVAGYVISMALIKTRLNLSLRPMLLPALAAFGMVGAVAGLTLLNAEPVPGLSEIIATLVLFILALASLRALQRYVTKRSMTTYVE